MIEEELVKIWQSSPNHEVVKFEKSRLMLDVQSGIDRFNKLVKNRDLREMAGGVIAVPIMAYIGFRSPYLLTKIGAVLSIISGLYVVLRLNNARRQGIGSLNTTYLQYLYDHKLNVRAQIHLLETVLYWYILPFYISISLMLLGPYLEHGNLDSFLIKQIGATIFALVIYYLNQQAIKKTLHPRLTKIDELIHLMES